MEDLSSTIFGFDGRQIATIWESIQASLPPVEHQEVKRLLGWDAVERNQALAEEARVLLGLLAQEEGALAAASADPKAAFERSALQSQIAYFISSIAAAAAGGDGGGGGGPGARAPAAAAAAGVPIKKGGGSSSSSCSTGSSGGAGRLGGTRELVQGVLHPTRGASRENELPAAAGGGGGGGPSWTAVAQARAPLCAALEAEEEALVADIAHLQGRVMEAASEARQGGQDTGALRARKAELQRRWLEVEASAAASAATAAAAAGAGPAAAAAGAASSTSSSLSRLHRALRAPSGRMGASEEGAADAAPAAAAGGGVGSLGSKAGGRSGGGVALSRGASAALAARTSAPLPSGKAAEAEAAVDDAYFLT
jgi:hypothetical protein